MHSLEVVVRVFLYNLSEICLDVVNIGVLIAEGDEHKNQVGFLFQRFVRELLSNYYTTSARFWLVMLG